jgi:hypothetical protein
LISDRNELVKKVRFHRRLVPEPTQLFRVRTLFLRVRISARSSAISRAIDSARQGHHQRRS